MYLLIRVKSLMSLKVRSILGPPKKFSKSPEVGRFSKNHVKSKSPSGVSYNFSKIYAKTRFSEFHERASQASSTQTNQTKYSQHEQSERVSQAQSSQIKQTKRSLRKSSKPSIVLISEARFASEQAKSIIHKPAKAKQTMARLSTRNSTIWLSFWCYTQLAWAQYVQD